MYIPKQAGRRSTIALFLAPALVGLIVFCLLPIAASVVYSFFDYDILVPFSQAKFVGLRNFTRILSGREFPQVLRHTLTYLVLYLPFILILSLLEALALNRSFRGRGAYRVILILIPAVRFGWRISL